MTPGVPGEWPVVGREAEIAVLRSSLLNPGSNGAILAGRSGSGKTALARTVAKNVDETFHPIMVRGSLRTKPLPYGALNFLLSELEDISLDNTLGILRGVGELVSERASDRQALFLVDHAEYLDDGSTMAIAHLVRAGIAKVMVVCGTVSSAPPEFVDMVKDGALSRVDVRPLGYAECAALLTEVLRAPVSQSAVSCLWRKSGGVPALLRLITERHLQTGALREDDGVWILVPGASLYTSPGITEWLNGRLEHHSVIERATLEIVTALGIVPLELLYQLADPAAVDSLQEDGSLAITTNRSEVLVSVVGELLEESLWATLPPWRSQSVLEQIGRLSNEKPLPERAQLRYVCRLIDAGMPVSETVLVQALRRANSSLDMETAAVIAAALPVHASLEGRLELARTCHLRGDFEGLRSALGSTPSRSLEELGLPLWFRRRFLDVQLLIRDHQQHGRAKALLCELEEVARAEVARGTPHARRALDETILLAAEVAVYDGDFAFLVNYATSQLQLGGVAHPSFRQALNGLLAHALCVTGHADEGLRLARSAVARALGDRFSAVAREAALVRHMNSLFVGGEWTECVTMLATHYPAETATGWEGATSASVEGVVLAYGGRAREALRCLQPGLAQLHHFDRYQILPAVEAATAYACSLVGDHAGARAHLARIDLGGFRYSWQVRCQVEYFSRIAIADPQEKEHIAHELAELGEVEARRGNLSQHLFFTCQALQLGHQQSASVLSASALAMEGTLARVCALFAKGMESPDAHLLLEAAHAALNLGDTVLARVAASQAAATAVVGADAELVTRAHGLLNSIPDPAGTTRVSVVDQLTAREREIAVLIGDGDTNREIAQQIFISVRTVEGHLRRIYTRLGISTRRQLRELLASGGA